MRMLGKVCGHVICFEGLAEGIEPPTICDMMLGDSRIFAKTACPGNFNALLANASSIFTCCHVRETHPPEATVPWFALELKFPDDGPVET